MSWQFCEYSMARKRYGGCWIYICLPEGCDAHCDGIRSRTCHQYVKWAYYVASSNVQLYIVSAGFDAAEGDELGECHVSPTGYAHMTHMLAGLAGGRLVVALEVQLNSTYFDLWWPCTTQGGYNLQSISRSALAVSRVLLGQPPDELGPMTANESATEAVWLVAREQSQYWKSVDPKSCVPREGGSILLYLFISCCSCDSFLGIEQLSFSIPGT